MTLWSYTKRYKMHKNTIIYILILLLFLACSKEQSLDFPPKYRGKESIVSNGYVYTYKGDWSNSIIKKSISNLSDSIIIDVPSNINFTTFKVYDNYLWYNIFDDKVYRYNLAENGLYAYEQITGMNHVSDFEVIDDFLYVNEYYGQINKININTEEKTKIITDGDFYFSIFEDYLYYVNQHNTLIQYNLKTNESIKVSNTTIKSADSESFVVGDYLIIDSMCFKLPVNQEITNQKRINLSNFKIFDNNLFSYERIKDTTSIISLSYYDDCIMQINEYSIETSEYSKICEPLKDGYAITNISYIISDNSKYTIITDNKTIEIKK